MTTNRADLVSGVGTMMTAFIAAHPTLCRRHFRSRPTSLVTDWPCSYLDLRPMTLHYDNGLRETQVTPSIVFVTQAAENGQVTDLLDQIVDAFTDHLDSYAHLVAGSVWSDGTWNDESEDLGDGTFAAGARFTFGPISFLNGRP
jgi:hypothetical protein